MFKTALASRSSWSLQLRHVRVVFTLVPGLSWVALQPCVVAQGIPNMRECLEGLLLGPSIIPIIEEVSDTSSIPWYNFQGVGQPLKNS